MKHRRNQLADHEVKSLRRLSREQARTLYEAPWKAYKRAEGDPLAVRMLVLSREGIETLQNFVRGAHGLPNRW